MYIVVVNTLTSQILAQSHLPKYYCQLRESYKLFDDITAAGDTWKAHNTLC